MATIDTNFTGNPFNICEAKSLRFFELGLVGALNFDSCAENFGNLLLCIASISHVLSLTEPTLVRLWEILVKESS